MQSRWVVASLGALLSFAGCSHSIGTATFQEVDPAVRKVEIAPETQVEARGKKVMVSTQGRAATQAAIKILRSGGNLVDAAVAASLAISVERPQSTGLGGGGFLIYHEAKSGKNYVFDFRERAPASAHQNLYLDKKRQVIPNLSLTGGLSVAVPGLVRGLSAVHKRFGKMRWAKVFGPAIDLATRGFELYPYIKLAIEDEKENLSRYKDSKRIFIDQFTAKNSVLRQPELAQTLKTLARDPEDFYRGRIASRIVGTVQRIGGIMTMDDLGQYEVKERVAVEADWNGYHVVSMPPPSSGGTHVVQILKLLEHEGFTPADYFKPRTLHLMASAMQQAFADRARYLGDPDFVRVPVKGLISDDYIRLERGKFNDDRARKQVEVVAGAASFSSESSETSHLSLMDSDGNVIVSTQTVNGWFGSKVVAEGTGIVLNNEMDDFSAKPGAANLFGAVGGDENSIQPKKTPLSSMSPTIVFKDGKPVMAVGAPGGTRIITAVAQTILNYFVFKKSLYASVAAPRIHQQWTPDQLTVENQAVPAETLRELDRLGWLVKRMPQQSAVMAIVREGNQLIGVADPRDIGTSAGF
ncbi:MAG: gamma-glutamyltransferase [Bdellovibrionales bacterium]|nr:gamma-glutamyltransferase [Bdellovibrionales bacterium]